jgi:tetratricopeptide (TPR) repeat protein
MIRNKLIQERSVLFILALLLLGGCSSKEIRKVAGEMDTPQAHYKQGMKYFNSDKIEQAQEEMNLASSLDPKFAPAFAGLALVKAVIAKKTGSRDTAELAEDYIKKAEDLDKRNADIWIAHARIITILNAENRKDSVWIKEALVQFNRAMVIDPNSGDLYFYRAITYRKAFYFDEAEKDFAHVLDLKKTFVAEADGEWKILQDVKRAARSENGKKLSLVDELNRADICVLFVDELNLVQYLRKQKPAKADVSFKAPPAADNKMKTETVAKKDAITDISDCWAKNFIGDVTALGLRGLDVNADHKFYPDSLINRGEFALMLEDICMAITKEDIKTKYIGAPSRFSDISNSHPYYNALCNAVDKGFLKADLNGSVYPQSSVSGAQALLIIRELRNLDKNLE